MAGSYDFYIEQGATFSVTFTWRDATGALVDLTDYTAMLQIRQAIEDEDPVVDLSHANGITLGGALGTIAVTISASATEELELDQYIYDLKLTDADGVATRLLEGIVYVSRACSR